MIEFRWLIEKYSRDRVLQYRKRNPFNGSWGEWEDVKQVEEEPIHGKYR